MSVISLIKHHPLNNNSFTPQPGSHLAHTRSSNMQTNLRSHPQSFAHTHTKKYKAGSQETCNTSTTSLPSEPHYKALVPLFELSSSFSDNSCTDNIKTQQGRRQGSCRLADGNRETSCKANTAAHHTDWPASSCCISMDTNGLLGHGRSH